MRFVYNIFHTNINVDRQEWHASLFAQYFMIMRLFIFVYIFKENSSTNWFLFADKTKLRYKISNNASNHFCSIKNTIDSFKTKNINGK